MGARQIYKKAAGWETLTKRVKHRSLKFRSDKLYTPGTDIYPRKKSEDGKETANSVSLAVPSAPPENT